ncbi:MAG: glycosyltransferase family 39 protein [archaeon]|nr:MAG: glycosyltransferase family 39 protein [archaeon]
MPTRRDGLARIALRLGAGALVALGVLLSLLVLNAASPGPILFAGVELAFLAFFVFVTSAIFSGLWHAYSTHPAERKAMLAVGIILGLTLGAHLYIINSPATADCYDSGDMVNGCIGDEQYYVLAGERIQHGVSCNVDFRSLVSDCNFEHPYLSKAFVGAGIALFGDNDFGWRIFQVLLGTSSLPLLYLLAWKLTASRRFSLIATVLLGLDTMFFVHSSAALIDVHMVFFSLLAFVTYFYRVKLWRLDRFVVSGALMGIAGLTKETAVFLALTLLTYHLLAGEAGEGITGGGWMAALKARLKPTVVIAVSGFAVFAVGLQVYDSLFVSSSVHSFIDHIVFMLRYGASLVGKGSYVYGPSNTPVTPFSWLTYYWPIPYLVETYRYCPNPGPGPACVSVFYTTVGYRSFTNLLEAWATFLWVPLTVYTLWKRLKPRSLSPEAAEAQVTGPSDLKVSLLSLLWFSWNYFPYLLLYALGRVTYPFYLIPAMPGLALGTAYLLTRKGIPRPIVYLYLAGVFGVFFVLFPVKAFLPEWLRILIGY